MAKRSEEKETVTVSAEGVRAISTSDLIPSADMADIVTVSPITALSLPELIGGFVQSVMEDRAKLNQCAHDLQLWHDAQPTENRRELVVAHKKAIETAKLTTE